MSEEKLLILPLNDDTSKRIAQTLANETARKILEVLCDGPMNPSQISEKLDISLTTLHYNIENLLESRLIKVEEVKYSEKGREIKIYSPTRKFIVIAPDNIGQEETKSFLRKALFSIYYLLASLGLGYSFQSIYYRYIGGIGTIDQPVMAATMEMAAEAAPVAEPMLRSLKAAPPPMPVAEPRLYLWFLLGAISALVLMLIWKKLDKKIDKK